jgi:uncharacterized membrane protein
MNTKQLLVFAALPSFLLAGHSAAKTQAKRDRHADEYSVVQIVLPPDPNCVAGLWHVTSGRRLNESGEVVGDDTCVIATGDETAPAVIGGSDAFRWNRASGATMLPALTAEPVETFGRDINESGTVIGWEFVSDGTSLAPVWPRAGGASLAIEGQNCDGFGALPLGNSINDRGDLLADDYRADATGLCRFVWVLKLASGEEFDGPANGAPRQLNNNGVAVGQSANRAMRWSPATGEVVLYEDPSAQSIGIALSINDRNEAVGRITQLNEQQSCIVSDSAAFWAASAQQTILDPLLGDTHAAALGINGISQVVGHSYRQPTCEEFDSVQSRAVIWQGTHAVDLNSLVPKRFAREFQLAIATAINDRGQIVARGVRRGEPKLPCPRFDYDPQTGENVYNASITCQNEYSFLLTPKQR